MTAGQTATRSRWLSIALPLLIGLTAAMTIAAALALTRINNALGAQESRLVELRAQRTQDQAGGPPLVAPSAPAVDLPVLRAKFKAVQDADRAVDVQAQTWRRGGAELKIVMTAVGTCMHEVDAYNRSAGWYATAQLAGLPQVVDLRAAATDCGGATLAKEAKGVTF